MSVDGFVSTGPNDEQKWVTLVWEAIKTDVIGLLDATDTILIGRKLSVDYIPPWQGVEKQPNDPFHGVAERICKSRKVARVGWDDQRKSQQQTKPVTVAPVFKQSVSAGPYLIHRRSVV